jgi:hypothetical protein
VAIAAQALRAFFRYAEGQQARTKRAWTPWKTAQNAVSHSALTQLFSLREKNEHRKK